MEAVLRLYNEAEQPGVVRLCMDERPCQLLDEVVTPLGAEPGRVKKVDNEYKREGTCVVLLAYDIDRGKRYCEVRKQRCKKDYAEFIDKVISDNYADAEQIKLVQDNLNTHNKGSFYEHLSIERAGELSALIEMVQTPKHGSWLNMAEIEFSALSRQCLDRRIATIEAMGETVGAWRAGRNRDAVKIHWSFTVSNAREKLKSQYQKANSKD